MDIEEQNNYFYINLIYLFNLSRLAICSFSSMPTLSQFNAILNIICTFMVNWVYIAPVLFCIIVQYGKEYEFEAPVKLLDKLLHSMPKSPDEQIVVVSQVFLACTHVSSYDYYSTLLILHFYSLFSWKISGRCLWLTLILGTRNSLTLRWGMTVL